MSKKYLFGMITDLHIKSTSDFDLMDSLFDQVLNNCEKRGVKHLLLLGDIFTYRNSQPLSALLLFLNMLKKARKMGINIIAIAGNHDKTDQESLESYLSVYSGNENFYVAKVGEVVLSTKDKVFCMLPYFPEGEDVYVGHLSKLVKQLVNDYQVEEHEFYLMTHISVKDARMNDGKKVSEGIPSKLFNFFKKVYVGHFHNKQEADNIKYMGSWRPKDFGEDNDKGMLFMDEFGSDEFVPLEFPKFISEEFSLPKDKSKMLGRVAHYQSNKKDNIRFVITGTDNDFTKLPITLIKKAGIKIKKVDKETSNTIKSVVIESVEKINRGDIVSKHLVEFAELFNIDKSDTDVFEKYYKGVGLKEKIRR